MSGLPIKPSGIAFVIVLLIVGCGSTPGMSTSNSTAIKQTEHLFELKCRESAQFLAVDPAKARSYLPAGYTVFVSRQDGTDMSRALPVGSAIFMMIYQECSSAIWDGVQLAPLKMVHQWIRVEGPTEILPVPGTAITVPTYYWYMLDDPTPHKGLRKKLHEAGLSSSMIESIDLGADVNGVRTGGVIERRETHTHDEIGYSFVENNRPAEQRRIGINHRLFHEQCDESGQCVLMKALDSGFIVPFGSGSTVTVTAHPDSSVGKSWGAKTLHGIASQFEEMEFRVKISSGNPVSAGSNH